MKVKGLLFSAITLLFLLSNSAKAQIDTIFWFAVPEAARSHADRPVYLRLSADDKPSSVTISIPARGINIATINVIYGVSSTVDLTPWVDSLENVFPNVVRNWGLKIQASEPITAYYEIQPNANTEIYTLKGKNGLGTKFITPFQTRFPNTTGFNGECWSSIDIVASENNTSVTIIPSTDVIGHKKGIAYNVVLNEGQTYSVRDSLRTKNTGNLSGTQVTSDKNISVSTKDDGIEIVDFINNYRDINGDQLMSFENVGKQYIVVKGELNPNDYVYIVGTANGTNLNINGTASVINNLQTVEASITANMYISADQPIYVYHQTGSQFETSSAILPTIECTGSSSISFTRANGNRSILLIAVPTSGTGSFVMNNNPALITAAMFTPVPGSPGWSAAKVDLTASMVIGSNTVKNTSSLFHMALVNGDNGSGGSAYGYFSNYKAEITAGKDSTICPGSTIKLADPGVYYSYDYDVLSGDMNSLLDQNTVKPNQTTTYILRRLGACPQTDTVTVYISDLKSLAGPDTTICSGTVRIGAKPSASGGTGPYTYKWSTGSTADTLMAAPGSYSLEVTDSRGCKASDAVVVTQNPSLNLVPDFIKPLCHGDQNGKAFLRTLSGGTSPYAYKWTGGSNNDTITVGVGTYKVVITDKNGCKDSTNVVVTEPSRLDIDTVVTPTGCPQVSTGRVVCSGTGGTSPYTFARGTGSFQSSGTFSNLASGTYKFYIKDANGCLDSAAVTINAGSPPVVIAPNDTLVCPGSELVFSGSSATSPISYTWTGGITDGVQFTATSNFTYVVTGTDANGCQGKDSTAVSLRTVPNATIGPVPSTICNDTSSIQLTCASPGATWSGQGMDSLTGRFTPSGAGTYRIISHVDNGCKNRDTVMITVIQRANASINPAGPFCTTAGSQQLVSSQPGGTWSGPGVSAAGVFSPAAAGNGNHIISYSIGGSCPDTKSITIAVNSSFDPTILPGGPYCATDPQVQLQSNTPGASWSGTGITDASIGTFDPKIAGPGTHTITHTIAGSCGGTDTEPFTVLPLDTARIIAPNDSICYNGTPVTLSATVTGGTWAGAVNSSGVFNPSGLMPGRHKVYYTYVQTCAYTDSIEIIIPDTLKASMANGSVQCFNSSNGTLSLIRTNGSAPFTYSWSDNASIGTSNRSNLLPGTYTGTVVDAIGCSASATATVSQPGALVISSITIIDDSCYQSNKGSVAFMSSGGTPFTVGRPYTYSINPSTGTLNSNGNGFTGLGAGSYTVQCMDSVNCVITQTFQINQPAQLMNYASAQTDYCGQGIGSCRVDSTKGGTAAFTYQWTGGPATATYSNLIAGNYTVTARDNHGCTTSTTVTVGNVAAPSISVNTTAVSCFGGNDGTAVGTVSGGTGALSYSWSDGNFNQISRNNFSQGSYWIQVTDSRNCKDLENFTINQPNKLDIDTVSNSLLCNGIPYIGTHEVIGGNPGPMSFYLNFVQQPDADFSLDQTGTYTAYARDSKGCYSDTITFTLTRDADINAALSPDQTVCRNQSVTMQASAAGGNGNYVYSWDNELPGTANKTYVTGPGNYPRGISVIVSDGCSRPDTVTGNIFLYPDATGTVSVAPKSGCYPLNSNFTVSGNLTQFQVVSTNGLFLGNGANFSYTFNLEGSYLPQLTGTTADGCAFSSNAFEPVVVHGYPVADFDWSPNEPTTVDNIIQLINHSTGTGNSYNWYGLDTLGVDTIFRSKAFSPEYVIPDEEGNYPVILVAQNQFGCVSDTVKVIRLKEELTLYSPNTFSPNEDGYNETFQPIFGSTSVMDYELRIFDRWGKEVFISTDPTRSWDGKTNGTPCKVDVYPFKLSYRQPGSSTKKQLLGRINLIR